MATTLQMVGATLLLLFLQWRGLRESSRSTRLFAYAFYAASVLIWTYLVVAVHVPRPSVFLEMMLRPFSLLD